MPCAGTSLTTRPGARKMRRTNTPGLAGGGGVRAWGTSPRGRAGKTAECRPRVTGPPAAPEARRAERLNGDASMPLEAFLALWARTRQDRGSAPADEESSPQARARL